MVATFGQLKAFNALARTGSFTRAARNLAVSQPAITAQIRRLESDHKVVLFERTAGGVQLTALGRRLFRITQNLDDLEEAASILLGGGDDVVPQSLRIATASPQVFMPVAAAFSRRYPDVELDIAAGSTGDAIRRLIDREADIALTPLLRADERLDHIVFLRHRLAALVPADHALVKHEAVSLSEVAAEPLIMRLGLSTTQKMADRALAMHGLRPRPILRLETREAVYEAVANHLGLALVLEHDVPPDPRFQVVPFFDSDVTAEESIVWLRSRRSLGQIRDFIDVAEGMSTGNRIPQRRKS
ncbi:LysR substrate-binding domain-containing protein [Rhodospira trueperi]|uniref:DNA-binding transcriptional regulator, LysR family n=1 Tax=Rhodospira trueperi TaxID=69960 RepID=A0A1G6X682_9PROT|nr:LysR substrate-binding domain-containing protein [Rhodospira trueperi]SDD73670.1 DNA-binding transcriptional regulator, LysR family [Rhodospira trueperi]